MEFYSTNNRELKVNFRRAVMDGIAPDGGLYMPSHFPALRNYFDAIENISFQEMAFETVKHFIGSEIPVENIKKIIYEAINFPAPIVELDENQYILELFHGPTLAFKDFGARFMAKTLSYFVKQENKEIVILVATSGDTGSAVANGFYGVDGIKVILLYPSHKVSYIQEQQLTTLDKNITALEIQGTFDDCQKLVKQAFADKDISKTKNLSSANSINIARLIPQSFYYINAYAQLKDKSKPLIFSVPSGNFGNLTAGLFAFKMGLPVHRFIAAVNTNDVVLQYLKTGEFIPRPSVKTLSNAMDVGNPSNFARILSLFNNDLNLIKKVIFSASSSDDETRCGIKEVYNKYNYIIDPHGSVGYLALKDFLKVNNQEYNSVILETAHPGKFQDIVEESAGIPVEIPSRLKECLTKEKKSIMLSAKYDEFKEYLINFK